MGYLPILLGLGTAVCWGTADYLSRRQSRLVGHYKTVIYSHVMTLFFLLVILTVNNPGYTISIPPIAVLVAIGALNFLAFVYLYRAFQKGVISIVAPVAYTYPAVTTVFSIFILMAALSPAAGLGITGVIAGVILLSTRFSELREYLKGGSSLNLTTGLGSAIAASFLFGVVYVGVGYATPQVGFAVPPVVLKAVAVVVGLSLAPILKESIRPSRAALSKTVISMGVLESIGFLAFNYGITMGNDALPIVAALSGMGGAVAASYGMFFLKERLELNQVLGLLLSFTGVFILLYYGG